MDKGNRFKRFITFLLVACIASVAGYFVYEKTDFFKPVYTIYFDVNGGKCDTEEITIKRKESVSLPLPTKTGNDFVGWYYGDEKITDTSKIRDNITLKAKWKAWSFDITFIVDGVSVVVPTDYGYYPEYGSEPIKEPTENFEYEFIGWQPVLEIATEDAIYTAQFEEKLLQYTVSFNAGGGVCSEKAVEVFPNQTVNLPIPTREGYEFLGWFNSGVEWQNDMPITADINLVAMWEILKFEITFVVDGETQIKTFNYGDYPNFGIVPSKPSTNYADYPFLKWEPALTTVKENKTYEAVFKEEIKYLYVNIDSNYNSAYSLTGNLKYTYGENVSLSITVNPGYEFVGWFRNDSKFSTDLNLSFDYITQNIDLYAEFNLLVGTISYNVGAYGVGLENLNPTTYTVLDGVINLNSLERNGYKMTGWYHLGVKYETINCEIIDDYTLDADWEIIYYNIEYELCGGVVSSENPSSYTIEDDDIILINPERSDFIFLGWIENGTEEPVKDLKIKSGSFGNRKFTAVWKSLVSTVTFIVDNLPLENETVYLNNLEILTAPTIDVMDYNMSGYSIDGWYTDRECTELYVFGGNVSSDLNLYGKWEYFINKGFYESLTKFKTANTVTSLNINSREELTAYIDYVVFYDITVKNYIKITYKTFYSAQEFYNEVSTAENDCIFPRNTRLEYSASLLTSGNITTVTKGSVYVESSHREIESVYTADPNKTSVCNQLDSVNYIKLKSDRTKDFDDFAINKINKCLDVETSNQLIYALECGLYPNCKSGSKAENILNKAKSVLREICDDDMTQIEKARAIYEWLVMNCQYDNKAVLSSEIMNNWWSYDAWFAEGVFEKGVAVCDGIAKAYLIMAKLEGIPTIRINSTDHAWNKIYIDGKWYGVDATHGNVIVNNTYEVLTYTSFMFTDTFKESEGYYASNYSEIVADTVFDYYSYAEVDEGIDFYITSDTDLKALLNYFNNYPITTEYLTIEFAVASTYTNFSAFKYGLYNGLSFSCELVSSFDCSSGYDIYVLYVA